MCKDGSYSSSAEKKGACRGHEGVKEWYGEESAAASKTSAATTTTTTAAPMASTSPAQGTGVTTSRKTSTTSLGNTASSPAAAPGGGAGQVWANDSSKVYHCSGDKWYGKTKHGEYMSEADAKAKGFHADHGKACG
jgi:hypothetical protein